MINSVNSSMPMQPMARTDNNLTEDQQLLISETLSQFDPENLTETDALTIIDAFSQAGIQPGGALEESMSELGFDAKTLGDLTNVDNKGGRPPPPPQQNTEEISSMVDYLKELIDEKLAASGNSVLSDEDKQSILTQVYEKFDIEDGESIIDTIA